MVATRFPQELKVKKGYPWSDQVGIVVGALCEQEDDGEGEGAVLGKGLVTWTVEVRKKLLQCVNDYTLTN